MKRRICESCLYFESAGFAKNGWCHHPSRRQNTDVRLMVRSNELNCRNGWNADLWVPANSDGAAQPSQALDPIAGRAASEVGPAEQNDLITSIVAAKTDNPSLPEHRPSLAPPPRPLIEEDIIVNQSPSLTWSAPSSGPISSQPATELVQNPKAAILRARDQFRQRRKTEGRLADQHLADPAPQYLASSREARIIHDLDLEQPEPDPETVDPRFENRPVLRPSSPVDYDDRRPVSPVSLREIDRPFPSMTDFPEDRARFESVPTFETHVRDEEALDIVQDDTWIETRQIDTVLPEPYVVDDFFEEDELVAESAPVAYEDDELSVHHRESILNRYLRQRRERHLHSHDREDAFEHEIEISQPTERPAPDAYVTPAVAARPEAPEPRAIQESRSWPPAPTVTDTARVAEDTVYTDAARQDSIVPDPVFVREAPATRPERRAEARMPLPPPVQEEDDFVIPPPLPEFQPNERQQTQAFETRRRSRVEPERDIRRPPAPTFAQPVADEFGDQPLFASQPLAVATDIELEAPYGRTERPLPVAQRTERICQTCRDFRPAENGERGWCNNKWAFNHRRMVDADDLACRNSLGSWWTPKDESWRRDGDISRHAQQTPRVDQWLLGTRENDVDRRRSGS